MGARLDPSSAFFGSLREKRLELRHNLGAVAVRALNALLFVLTDRHSKGETLATLLTKIFVERHNQPPLLLDSLASSAKYYLNGFLVLSLCIVRLLYGSGSDSVDRKAKFHYELLQRR